MIVACKHVDLTECCSLWLVRGVKLNETSKILKLYSLKFAFIELCNIFIQSKMEKPSNNDRYNTCSFLIGLGSFFYCFKFVLIVLGLFLIVSGSFLILSGSFLIVLGSFLTVSRSFLIVWGLFLIVSGSFLIVLGSFFFAYIV